MSIEVIPARPRLGTSAKAMHDLAKAAQAFNVELLEAWETDVDHGGASPQTCLRVIVSEMDTLTKAYTEAMQAVFNRLGMDDAETGYFCETVQAIFEDEICPALELKASRYEEPRGGGLVK